MDQKELQEKIALYYSKLPPEAQKVFSDMKWLETLKTISIKYGLDAKQIETLSTETTLILLGIIHPVEYEETLTKELGLSENSTEKILLEIEESITKGIRPQLVKTFEANKESETETIPEVGQKPDARFDKLPKEIENIVKESNYQTALYNISRNYNLNVEQMGILENTIVDLITGKIHPDEFEGFLENGLRLELNTLNKLVNDVNNQIFRKIRAKLEASTTQNSKKGEINTYPLEESVPTTTHTEKEKAILNKAGIQIVPEKLELNGAQKTPLENPTPIQTPIQKTESAQSEIKETKLPISAQKLSGSMQTPVTKTEHTLDNLTPNKTPNTPPKIDPYREVPE